MEFAADAHLVAQLKDFDPTINEKNKLLLLLMVMIITSTTRITCNSSHIQCGMFFPAITNSQIPQGVKEAIFQSKHNNNSNII
jgi:hypothetical protein